MVGYTSEGVQEEGSQNRINGCIFVIVLAVMLTLPWLGRPFQSRGEPREALVAQSMVVNSNWISPPAYNGAVPSKPPFNHWLISLVSLPGGEVTEFTSRLPSALAVILFSGAFYLFLARRTSIDSALVASLVLLSSFEWFRGAVTCRVDTLLSTSMAGALLALFAWREGGRKGFPWLAAVLISCAALTKGPIGVALPLAIFSLFEFLSEERSVKNIFAIGLRAVVISLPVIAVVSLWYVAGYLQRGDEFLDKIYYENFQRLTSSMADEPHKHAAPYMVLMLALGLLRGPLCGLSRWSARCRGDRSLCPLLKSGGRKRVSSNGFRLSRRFSSSFSSVSLQANAACTSCQPIRS